MARDEAVCFFNLKNVAINKSGCFKTSPRTKLADFFAMTNFLPQMAQKHGKMFFILCFRAICGKFFIIKPN
jgi:hypothetical protein